MPDRSVNLIIAARDNASRVFDRVGDSVKRLRQAAVPQPLGGLAEVGRFFVGTHALAGGIEAITAGLAAARGDSEKFLEVIERMPFGIGAAARAGHSLYEELSSAREEAERLAKVGGAIAGMRAGFPAATDKAVSIFDMAAKFKTEAKMAGMDDAERRIAEAILRDNDRRQAVEKALKDTLDQAAKTRSDAILKNVEKIPAFSGKFDDESLAAERRKLRDELANARRELNAARTAPESLPYRDKFDRAAGMHTRAELESAARSRIANVEAQLRPIDAVFGEADAKYEAVAKLARENATAAYEASQDLLLAETRRAEAEPKPAAKMFDPVRFTPILENSGGGVGYKGIREMQMDEARFRKHDRTDDGGRKSSAEETAAQTKRTNEQLKELISLVRNVLRAPVLNAQVGND